MKRLDDSGWQDRFIARQALVSLGTASLPELEELLQHSKISNALGKIGVWLVRSIGWDTTRQLAHQAREYDDFYILPVQH